VLKEGSVGPPSRYLGADISKFQLYDGRECWAMSPDSYIKSAIKVVEDLLAEDNEGKVLKGSARTPFVSGYRPEVDLSRELDPAMASRYSQLIGIL